MTDGTALVVVTVGPVNAAGVADANVSAVLPLAGPVEAWAACPTTGRLWVQLAEVATPAGRRGVFLADGDVRAGNVGPWRPASAGAAIPPAVEAALVPRIADDADAADTAAAVAAVTLASTGVLAIDGHVLATDVTSFVTHTDVLIFTTRTHHARFLPWSTALAPGRGWGVHTAWPCQTSSLHRRDGG